MYRSALRYREQGDYERARAFLDSVLETRRRLLGGEHPETLAAIEQLGATYEAMSDLARAEPLYQELLSARRRTLGSEHVDTARAFRTLGTLYALMGDYSRAKSYFEEALPIVSAALGQTHPETSQLVVSLAAMHAALGENERAEFFYQGALSFYREARGNDDPFVAVILYNLATLYVNTGELDRAAPLFDEALTIRRKALGKDHPDFAAFLKNAAHFNALRGDRARAEALYGEALAIERASLPAQHPQLASTLAGLGGIYAARGDDAKAEPLLREALEIGLRSLDLASLAQSDRQLMVMTSDSRRHLESYLSLTLRGAAAPATAWSHTVRWKGRAIARQSAAREAVRDEETRALFAAMQRTAAELSQRALGPPGRNVVEAYDISADLVRLSEHKERLERELARRGARYQQTAVDGESVRASLPAHATLLDAFEVDGRIAMFVVPRQGEIRLVDLGAAEAIGDSVDRWHVLTRSGIQSEPIAQALRRLVWAPIEPLLPEEGLVLISAEGALGRLAFSALPGRTPGRFLIEERPIAMIPAPRMLPAISALPSSPHDAGGLLLLGDVNYGAGTAFEALPGTAAELAGVQRVYRSRFSDAPLKVLRGAAATEGAVRENASGYSHLHFATHGFFADERFRSALARTGDRSFTGESREGHSIAGYHPGLLSGLVFAGANRPALTDDGILTAEEVATLDLSRVNMVVLSACESGLGQAAGGDGLLGLQRAFQAAGARAVIATLWQVDDDATRVLMERFYANLWTKKMGKLEALREAQLSMLRDGRKAPFYWAAFVLSGDWR